MHALAEALQVWKTSTSPPTSVPAFGFYMSDIRGKEYIAEQQIRGQIANAPYDSWFGVSAPWQIRTSNTVAASSLSLGVGALPLGLDF